MKPRGGTELQLELLHKYCKKELLDQVNICTSIPGKVPLSKNKLNEQEDILKSEIKKLETEEVELARSLSEKYGKGSLDIETGTFTPIE